MATLAELTSLEPRHETLVGIDSDGCVFDSMTVKQRECFHSAFLDTWKLHAVEKPARECLEFVNLFSRTRGQDRFICLDLAVRLMKTHPEIDPGAVELPDTTDLQRWLSQGPPFGNAGLEAALQGGKGADLAGSPSLARILDWSRETDRRVRELPLLEPFPDARRFLEELAGRSDAVVVSSTPLAALQHEWKSLGLREHVRLICSKDIGSKTQHLQTALADGKYRPERTLMIGDAPKDLECAREAGVRFYPIVPGRENDSWRRLRETVYPDFLENSYTFALEESFIGEFLDHLPVQPPWQTGS